MNQDKQEVKNLLPSKEHEFTSCCTYKKKNQETKQNKVTVKGNLVYWETGNLDSSPALPLASYVTPFKLFNSLGIAFHIDWTTWSVSTLYLPHLILHYRHIIGSNDR